MEESTLDQDTFLQGKALLGMYPDGGYLEGKKSGTTMEDRQALRVFLQRVPLYQNNRQK